MANAFPVVIPAAGRYIVDMGAEKAPRFHNIEKNGDGKAHCTICGSKKCPAIGILVKYRKDGGQECLPESSSKPVGQEIEERVEAMLARDKAKNWQPQTDMEKYWGQVRSAILAGALERERAGREEHEQYQLWASTTLPLP